MKLKIYFSFASVCVVSSLNAASTFMPDASTVVFTDGTINTSSLGADKSITGNAASLENLVGLGNSYISFTSLATRGNLQAYASPTYITSTVSGNGGTFDLSLRTAVLENSTNTNKTATTNQSYDRHKIISNGDTSSFTFTQTYSQAWMPSRQYLANSSLSGNLIWSLARGVDFGTQDTSLVAIDVRYYDENLNTINLTAVEFRDVADANGYGNAASFSQNGTTATLIYKAGVTNNNNPAGITLVDFNTGNLDNEFIGKIEYTFRTTDGSNFANNVAFQYTTNGAVYASSPEVIPEPTAFVIFGVGAFSLILRRKR